jgi:hypothetical protein
MGKHKISYQKSSGYCVDKKKEKKEPKKAWIDKEIVKLIDERQKYKNNNTREGQQKYRQLRIRLTEKQEKLKNGWSSSAAKLTNYSKLTK